MAHKSKRHLVVKKDKINKWYTHECREFRIQLCGDPRLGGYWIEQYAIKAGRPDFMKDLTAILKEMEKDGKSAFTLYELE